jgi:hypothetical protein
MTRPNIMLVCFTLAALLPMAAHGSFSGTPCRADFACHFLFWGFLLGVAWGIPASMFVFILLHVVFCNPARSKVKQGVLGGLLGIVAFEISAVCAALLAARTYPALYERYPLIGFASAFVLLAIASVLYARSSPGHRRRGQGAAAG